MTKKEPEVLSENSPREINFYGEDTSFILEENIKLTTLRKDDPKYHGLKVGESIIANCEGVKVPLIVWGVQESIPLGEVDPILRGIDGFTNLDRAIIELRKYPGYEAIGLDSPMVVIATIHRDRFYDLSNRQQTALLAQQDGKPLSEVVRSSELGDLIKFSLARWIQFHDGHVEHWLKFYLDMGLVTQKEYADVLAYHDQQNYNPEHDPFGSSQATSEILTNTYSKIGGLYGCYFRPYVFADLNQAFGWE